MNRVLQVATILALFGLLACLLNSAVRTSVMEIVFYWVSIWVLSVSHLVGRHNALKSGRRSLAQKILTAIFLALWSANMLTCVYLVLTKQSGLRFTEQEKRAIAKVGFVVAAVLLPSGYFLSHLVMMRSNKHRTPTSV